MRGVTLLFAAACALAALAPLAAPRREAAWVEAPFPGWPTSFQGMPLTAVALGDEELRFQESFPGRIAHFDLPDGRGHLLVRWVYAPTRKLHPSRHCYRGAGYAILTKDAFVDGDGRTWSQFDATSPEGRCIEAREIVFDQSFTTSDPDVETWYWNASIAGAKAPSWWALTWVTEPAR